MDPLTKRRLAKYRASVRNQIRGFLRISPAIPRHIRLAQIAVLRWSLDELHRRLYPPTAHR